MTIHEFIGLSEAELGEAVHEVCETIRRDSPGCDHIRSSPADSPTGRLILGLSDRVAARAVEYGRQAGLTCGLMLAFRIGAAYGRRVPVAPGDTT